MDPVRFDTLARTLATPGQRHRLLDLLASGHPRRRLLTALTAAAGMTLLGIGPSAADRRHNGPKCPATTGCEAICRNTKKICTCVRHADGSRGCVHPCCSNRTCRNNKQCGGGEVCMKSVCCGPKPVCVTKCGRPIPAYCGGKPGTRSEEGGVSWGA